MELIIHTLPLTISLILTLLSSLKIIKTITLNLNTPSFKHQNILIKNKKKFLLFITLLTLFLLILYLSITLIYSYNPGYTIYRSIKYSPTQNILTHIELLTQSLLNSIMFYTLSLIIPLLTKNNVLFTEYTTIYAFIRLIYYPLINLFLNQYYFTKIFIIEIFNLSENFLLFCIFFKLFFYKRNVVEYNLISVYEYEYVFLKMKFKCKKGCFMVFFGFLCNCFNIYFMVCLNVKIGFDFLFLCCVFFKVWVVFWVFGVVFCKEQETFDNLINFVKK